jgi:hypothetical protein
LQLFHVLNSSASKFDYVDDAFQTNKSFYKTIYLDTASATTQHYTDYKHLDNKIGAKGRTANLFYAGFVRLRNIEYQSQYVGDPYPADQTRHENYTIRYFDPQLSFGFDANYSLKKFLQVGGSGEYTDDGVYRTSLFLKSKYVDAEVKDYKYEPSILQRIYFGNFYQWDNLKTFKNTTARQVAVRLKLDVGKLHVSPFAEFSNLTNYVYFDTTAVPVQESGSLKVLKAGLDVTHQMGVLNQRLHAVYAQNDDKNLIRMPEYFVNYQVYLEKEVFKKALFMQFGVDVHWQSAYFANAYMPVTQQFHLQDRYKIGNYLSADLFLNYRIKRVTMFAKVTNIAQPPNKGYFITPDYMGQPRTFEFGLVWLLFD